MQIEDSPRAPSTVERQRMVADRPIFRGLDPRVLNDLDAALEVVRVPAGARIMQKGQGGVPFFVILQGGVRASYVDGGGRCCVVFEYFQGASFGEALVLSGRPSPLDVHAIRDTVLLSLAPERFRALAARHPDLALSFAQGVTTRVVELFGSREFLASFAGGSDRFPRIVAVLSAGARDVWRTRDLLLRALSRSRTTTRLTVDDARAGVDGQLDWRGQGSSWRLVQWLGDLQARSDLVVLEAERSDGFWRDFCLRQADRIVVLSQPDEQLPYLGAQPDWWREAKLGELPARIELAIVHPRSTALPRAGAAYARLPGVVRVHHIKSDETEGAERVARWLLDRPVGLVLGGGGAYGIAHVGVLKALEEARVPIDVVGGTSMGAIFAGGLARGWSADQIMERVRDLFASRFALYDPTIPLRALLLGRKLRRVLQGFFEDIDIADLWTPFFCVSTNISRAGRQVHDEGMLYDAIRASCSIPGLFPPHEALRQLFVDGGLVDNLPIDVMAERCRGPVIAVDVFPYRRAPHETNGRARGSRPELRERVRRLVTTRPPIFDTLVHATLAGSQHGTELSLSKHPLALHLVPQLEGFRILDWGAYRALFEAGYVCAKRELDAGSLPRSLWEGAV